MTIYMHHLFGCTPDPLAHYLKGLGVFRIVAEQSDPSARMFWRDEHAVLVTKLSESELVDFWLKDYIPTPIVSPWNLDSGFYPGRDSEPIDMIVKSTSKKLVAYRNAIALARRLVDSSKGEQKLSPAERKALIVPPMRREARGPLADWLACVVLLDSDGKPSCPPLLSGGNDGRLDFSFSFMKHLGLMFDLQTMVETKKSSLSLRASLFSLPAAGVMEDNSIGLFLPGDAGGANSTAGYDGKSSVNSWDDILCMEGTPLFASAITKRSQPGGLSLASSPFSVSSGVAGYGTAVSGKDDGGSEQWMPVWERPSAYTDVQALFTDGRMQIQRRMAESTMDAAIAVSRLGVAAGVAAFQPFAYKKRQGKCHLAIPLPRYLVSQKPMMSLVENAAGWIGRLVDKAQDKKAPGSWKDAARRCEDSVLNSCRNGAGVPDMQETLLSMGSAEYLLARTPKASQDASLRPLSNLPYGWTRALPDTREFRLALALAGQVGVEGESVDFSHPIREHFIPMDGNKFADRPNPDIVATTGNLLSDAAAIVCRRLYTGKLSLCSGRGNYADLSDVAAFIRGEVDDNLILDLARPLMALESGDAGRPAFRAPKADDNGSLALYGVLRLAHQPRGFMVAGTTYCVNTNPSVVHRLLTGDSSSALGLASHQLISAGLRPYVRSAIADALFARRLVASLIFPVSPESVAWLADRLCYYSAEGD